MEIDLRNLRDVVNPAYFPLLWAPSRYLVLMGGAGSGKSVFAAQKLLARLVTEPGHNFCVLRKVQATLRNSCFTLLKSIISQWGWAKYFRDNLTDLSMTFLPTGSRLISTGLDDPEKLKSIAGVTGFWIEEATELAQADFEQVDLRLRGRTPSYKQVILSFNPISRLHWLKSRFFDTEQHGDTKVLRTTYRDNLHLDPDYIRKLEHLQERNEALWRVYGLGEWGVFEGLVYDPPILDTWPTAFQEEFMGLDFGFNNPTALVWVGARDVNRHTQSGDIYLREVIYQSGLTTPDLAERMKQAGVSQKIPIYADPAEPDRIQELYRWGFNVKPARKGEGSILSGINLCRTYRLHSLPNNPNLNAEFETYSWNQDRKGLWQDAPVKVSDHLMDAMRYAISTHLGRPAPAFIDRGKLKL